MASMHILVDDSVLGEGDFLLVRPKISSLSSQKILDNQNLNKERILAQQGSYQ